MKRLYIQIYLTVVASLVLVVIMAGAMWRFALEAGPGAQAIEMVGEVAAALLPPADAPREQQRQALARLAAKLNADFALFGARRERIADAYARPGATLLSPPEPSSHGWSGWRSGGTRSGGMSDRSGMGGSDGGWTIRLPDERALVVRLPHAPSHPGFSWVAFLIVIALAVALAAHPIVRRLTRRLERLESSVNALGQGDLSARVKVHGQDEIARLARSFNRAAERIESLVNSHRMLLANASHELRTPLSRIRLGVELLKSDPDSRGAKGGPVDTAREAELEGDIAELDELIEEILTASRLDATVGLETREEVDLLALAAEECARYDDCALDGDVALVQGDPRLLRRLVRNLLENARKHGAAPFEVSVKRSDGGVRLRVCDRGHGVPEAERERIFEPFYRVASPGGCGGHVGAGLGLALVRQIARRHGGDATAAPREGGGTCISVTLALA